MGIVADPDPYHFLDLNPYPSLMGKTKLTGRENLTTYECFLGLGRPTYKGNQVNMYKK
jgi:hypothetical protein